MTEEEAKTKWCPFARVALGWTETIQSYDSTEQAVGATVNRGERISSQPNCIGSACMAWRWEVETEYVDENSNKLVFEHGDAGYCGLSER